MSKIVTYTTVAEVSRVLDTARGTFPEIGAAVNGRVLQTTLGANAVDHTTWAGRVVESAALSEGVDFRKTEEISRTKPTITYWFTPRAGKHIAMMSRGKNGTVCRDYFIQMEGVALEVVRPSASLPMTYLDSLKALVASLEAKEKAEAEVAELTAALDRDFGYVSIIRAASFAGVSETRFNWRVLKAASERMGCVPKKVPSPRYEYQNLYPIAAFVECYPECDFSGLKPDGIESVRRLSGVAA
jgi:phage anti-repressor protein